MPAIANYEIFIILTTDLMCLNKLFDACSIDIPNIQIQIEIDGRQISYLPPAIIVALAQCVIFLHYQGKSINLNFSNFSPENIGYLNDIEFPDFLKNNLKQGHNLQPLTKLDAFPLWRLTLEYQDEYIQSLGRYFSQFHPRKDWSPLTSIVSELLNNVADHSDSPIGAYTFARYDKVRNELRIIISDMGIGLSQRICQFELEVNGDVIEPMKAFRRAFQLGFSSQSRPHNRGRGLNNLLDITSNIDDGLTVYNNGFIILPRKVNGEIEIHQLPSGFITNSFKGTLVEVVVNPRYFPELEEDITLDFG